MHKVEFLLNRTGNKYAGVGADKALKQTINVEAKSLLKKTMADADVPSASIGALLQTI